MFKPDTIATDNERAIIVGIILPNDRRWEVQDNLAELRQLAGTAGCDVVDELVQERDGIHSAHFIGKGKVEELKNLVAMHEVATVIFDHDLTPAQVRNLEKSLEVKIIDRSALILDIFAGNARTRTAKTQVELAQLQYFLPRLTRQWTHLSRQVGGIGTKGPGETQLETDRRLIRNRIETLRRDLARIDRQRTTQRKSRDSLFRASLIGYTNVGKSTIMNLLTGARVLVENQLFATLDSTVRKVRVSGSTEVLLSDTVGFIRKLPHHLVASFKSTLDEVLEADLLIHVVDASHRAFAEQIRTVTEVVKELGADEKPVLLVFNKIDLLEEKGLLQSLRKQYPDALFISAARHIRTEQLREALVQFVESRFVEGEVEMPLGSSQALVSRIHDMATVIDQEYSENGVRLRFRCSAEIRDRIFRLVDSAPAPTA